MNKKKRNRLLNLFLVLVLVLSLTPARAVMADWKDQLWDVYDQMGGDDSNGSDSYQNDQQDQNQNRNKKNKKNKKQNNQENNQKRNKKQDSQKQDSQNQNKAGSENPSVEKNGSYNSKWEVAAYLNAYGELPDNYITKKQAQKLGWSSSAGNLDEVAPGKSIGGDHFGNYEGVLPEERGRDYYECDIDFDGGYRGAKRIIFSDDGLIFYTEDHYKSFEQLYPESERGTIYD